MNYPVLLDEGEEEREVAEDLRMDSEVESGSGPDVVDTIVRKIVGDSDVQWTIGMKWEECCLQNKHVLTDIHESIFKSLIIDRAVFVVVLSRRCYGQCSNDDQSY